MKTTYLLNFGLAIGSLFFLQNASASQATSIPTTSKYVASETTKAILSARMQQQLNKVMNTSNDEARPNPQNAQILKPIRLAMGNVQVVRSVMEFDPLTGKMNNTTTPVCILNATVEVFDTRGKSDWIVQGQGVECIDNYQGNEILIGIAGHIFITNLSIFGRPPQDQKSFSAMAFSIYKNSNGLLPEMPYQHSFSPDLNQVYFGAITTPNQFVSCSQEQPETEAPRPLNGLFGPACTVGNPLAYQVIWEVEDRP